MRTLDAIAASGLLLACACTDGRASARATCVLVDVSGTYADQRQEVVRIVQSGLLPRMRPGDSFIVIRIHDRSYDRASVEASVTFDSQPSRANAQKLALAGKLDRFARSEGRAARYTDISGAILLAAEYLRESRAGARSIVIFSDMKEELPRGSRRTLGPGELQGIEVTAMNVKRLAADNLDPAGYRNRLGEWGTRVTRAGAASWKVVLDPEELAQQFARGP
ncbi:MAG TPA: hypothetical protein VH880_03440 [Anaeromyxobacteraceae bacterium]